MPNPIPTTEELQSSLKIILTKGGPNVRVLKNIYIKLYGVFYIIPKGFKSDGASIPLWLTALFRINPFDKNILLFSILHDYFYRTQFLPRFMADAIYEIGLEQTSSKLIAKSFYVALRSTGGLAWSNNAKRGLETHPKAYNELISYICDTELKENIDE